MDPVSALIFGCVIAWLATKSAAEAAVDQAKTEARAAASAIRDDLRGRGDAWAQQLRDRLDAGKETNPYSALWWGWAAFRTARALHRALRKEPREAERVRAIRDTSGPFRRIWEAGQRGGRYAWDETRRKHNAKGTPKRVPVGVCERCGVVAAKSALAPAATRFGVTQQMCAKCRADVAAERAADERDARNGPSPAAPDMADADVVGDRPAVAKPRPEIAAPPTSPTDAHRGPQPSVPPAPVGPQHDRQLDPGGPRPVPPAAPELPTPTHPGGSQELDPPKPSPVASPATPTSTAPEIEGGTTMPPRNPGTIVPTRTNAALTRPGGGVVGASHTHGQWLLSVATIEKALNELPGYLDAMLRSLTTADAGRTQVQGVIAVRNDITAFIADVREMLHDVNRRERPMIRAVENAGGPDEIAAIPYFQRV